MGVAADIVIYRDPKEVLRNRSPHKTEVVIETFNSVFDRYRKKVDHLWHVRCRVGNDRRFFSPQNIEMLVGFDVMCNGIAAVMGRSNTIFTDHALSPELASYTFPVRFPNTSGEEDIEVWEWIPVNPLLPFLDREMGSVLDRLADKSYGWCQKTLVNDKRQIERERGVLAIHGVPYMQIYAEKGFFLPSFLTPRARAEAFFISQHPLRTAVFGDEGENRLQNLITASTTLHGMKLLVVG